LKHINLLHIIYSLEIGGAEMDLVAKAKVLVEEYGYHIAIACLLRRGELVEEAERNGIRVIGPVMSGKSDIRVIPRLVRTMCSGKFDIVHTHMFAANFLGRLAALLAGVPVIVSTVQLIAEREKWWEILLDRALQLKTGMMITSSEAVRRSFIERGIREDKITTIYNGIDFSKFDSIDRVEARNRIRPELGLKDSTFLVGTVARLQRVKGVECLIEAANHIVESVPNARFLIVGDGPQKAELQYRIKQLDLSSRFIFAGTREDVPAILSALDLFVLPSLSEALGIAVIEALLMRVPVVATNVGGVPEVVKSGETGLLVPPKDPIRLGEAIAYVYSNRDRAIAMARAGERRVRGMFEISRLAQRQVELYEMLLARRQVES
jgi:glycosyltransferase involved in cell wall biosynthesis